MYRGGMHGRGEDRFYNPSRVRGFQNRLNEEPANPLFELKSNQVLSNIQLFLKAVTPRAPAHYPSKTDVKGWRVPDVEFQPYYLLGDLWESFQEWSAYGAGVPLVLNERDQVVQYYVPYLSAIQIYGDSMKPSVKLRHVGEDSDNEYIKDSSSDGSCEYEHEGGLKGLRENCNRKIHRLSVRDQNTTLPEDLSSDESELGNCQGYLLFEYLERDSPYSREPLSNKILDLAHLFPKLKTLRSCDLLPSSWMSVAWYPIYRIPTGPTLRDLDACFLTFHHLHTPMRGGHGHSPLVTRPSQIYGGIPNILLPIFGLSTYKLTESLWTSNGEYQLKLTSTLLHAADSWLNKVQVKHPDYLFFTSR